MKAIPVEDLELINLFFGYLHGRSVGIPNNEPRSSAPISNRPEYVDNRAELLTRAINAESRLRRLERGNALQREAAVALRYLWLERGQAERQISITYAQLAKKFETVEDNGKREYEELVNDGFNRYRYALAQWKFLDDL